MTERRRLGVDTGGTFTDFVWLDKNGRLQVHKQLSTPQDPSAAILAGIAQRRIGETTDVVHGSTVATNALLERRVARTALITTKGFGDVLAIGRQNRPDIYALVPQKPPPLVPDERRFEVNERVTAQGEILTPLDENSVTAVLHQIAAVQIESVAVCLLFSFLYPAHERQIRRLLLHRFPDLHVSLSSDILPEYREYERTSTTVINAAVAPLMGRYLRRLAEGLRPRRLTVMQSNGGVISAETAAAEAARTALSGPAGGVVGARFVAAQAGFEEIITFDMGGTSSDVALCPGRLPTTSTGEIAGMPLRLPLIDIHTVGAGGGSVAYIDAGGALHVGPQSAGADPGPSCYGRSSQEWRLDVRGALPLPAPVTVTDANLLLGRLHTDHFLGGEMRLHETAARTALAPLAQQMGADSLETAAWGIIQVANANMERAIRRISVERGHDPRRFTLVAFGGAGPLHACDLAANLSIPRVLIPAVPGVLSALGMLAAAPTKDYSQTIMMELRAGDQEPGVGDQEVFMSLRAQALAEMATEGYTLGNLALRWSLDMRYRGQSHELNVLLKGPAVAEAALIEAFHAAHEARYGYRQPHAVVELVTLRLTAVAPVTPPDFPKRSLGNANPSDAVLGEKPVWFDRQPAAAKLYDRAKLRPGNRFAGPAVVFQYDTTTVIPPGWETAVDEYGNLNLGA